MFLKSSSILLYLAVVFPIVKPLSEAEVELLKTESNRIKQTYPTSGITITTTGDYYQITSVGVPNHATGPFQNNPNTVQDQNYVYNIHKNVKPLNCAGCLPMGVIGMGVNGIPFYNPYTSEGYNAVEGDFREYFDSFWGHPDQNGRYHYHRMTPAFSCNDNLIGIALDGYPIYCLTGVTGLDSCNAKKVGDDYRYYVTDTFPYYMGCFWGTVVSDNTGRRKRQTGGQMGPGGAGMGGAGAGGAGTGGATGGGGSNCFYANVSQPEGGASSLTAGILNMCTASKATECYVSHIYLFGCFVIFFTQLTNKD